MKISVISDIHGNFRGELIDYLNQSDYVICLGDLDGLGKICDSCVHYIKDIANQSKFFLIPGNSDPECLKEMLSSNPEWSLERTSKYIGNFSISGFGGTINNHTFMRRFRKYLHKRSVADIFRKGIDAIPSGIKVMFDKMGIVVDEGILIALPETPDLERSWNSDNSPCRYEEDEIRDFFMDSTTTSDIWVSHTPPFGFPGSGRLGGISIGSEGLLEAIQAKQPLLVLSGHIHKEGQWKIGNTLCLSAPALLNNAFMHVEINDENVISFSVVELD